MLITFSDAMTCEEMGLVVPKNPNPEIEHWTYTAAFTYLTGKMLKDDLEAIGEPESDITYDIMWLVEQESHASACIRCTGLTPEPFLINAFAHRRHSRQEAVGEIFQL